MRKNWAFCLLAVSLLFQFTRTASADTVKADFVFLVDASGSMGDNIAAVRSGMNSFISGLASAGVDPRFAIIVFGGQSELVLDFTSSGAAAQTAFNKITIGANPGFQINHNANPEAGLEAIRIALGGAVNNTLLRTNVGGTGGLVYRADARKNLILITDEDSDQPFLSTNRLTGQTTVEPPASIGASSPWQTEINNTADVVINNNAFLNMLINPLEPPSVQQYGDPSKSVQDPNFLNFNPAATLAALQAGGLGNSLEAQILQAGLIGRAYDIGSVNNTNFVNNFFAAKIEETVQNPVFGVPIPSAANAGVLLLALCLAQNLVRRRARPI
jgi:hypothetical protein